MLLLLNFDVTTYEIPLLINPQHLTLKFFIE
jgi:hypothetical protein